MHSESSASRVDCRLAYQVLRRASPEYNRSHALSTTLTSKAQFTIPKQIRDALTLAPGCAVYFAVNREGDVVIHRVGARSSRKPDRFESARGRADVQWRTDDLMALLRSEG